MNKERRIAAGIVLAGAVALGGGVVASQAEASTPSRTISCSKIADKWVELKQNEVVLLKTSSAIGTIDASVDGVPQYDNDDKTSTVLEFKSRDNKKKSWLVEADFAGAINVLKCGASFPYTDARVGQAVRRMDRSLGRNNADKRVNFQLISK